SGFADAKEATAKNYTGETDVRSATELMRIRGEVGLTEATQVGEGLRRAQGGDAAAIETKVGEKVWKPDGDFKETRVTVGPGGAVDATTVEALKGTIPKGVLEAMELEEGKRTPEQKAEVEKFMREQGLDVERQKQVEEKTREGIGRGLPYVVALATALAL